MLLFKINGICGIDLNGDWSIWIALARLISWIPTDRNSISSEIYVILMRPWRLVLGNWIDRYWTHSCGTISGGCTRDVCHFGMISRSLSNHCDTICTWPRVNKVIQREWELSLFLRGISWLTRRSETGAFVTSVIQFTLMLIYNMILSSAFCTLRAWHA